MQYIDYQLIIHSNAIRSTKTDVYIQFVFDSMHDSRSNDVHSKPSW